MYRNFVFMIFFTTIASSQPVKITIDKITSTNYDYERKFTVEFTIANNSDKPVSFLLNPASFIPAHDGSMVNAVFFKVYETTEIIPATHLLNSDSYYDPEIAGLQKTKRDSIIRASLSDTENLLIQQQKNFMGSLISLAPGESRNYTKDLHWNFERYQKQDELEFYVDNTKPHYLELSLIFLKEEYVRKVSAEQFAELMANPTLIKGWFASNKMEIDFSE